MTVRISVGPARPTTDPYVLQPVACAIFCGRVQTEPVQGILGHQRMPVDCPRCQHAGHAYRLMSAAEITWALTELDLPAIQRIRYERALVDLRVASSANSGGL